MNRKCSTEPPQSSKTEEKEGEDIITDKTDLVEETAHIIGFPFTKTAESQVATALSNQQVLAFPTETFYGLGGNAFSKKINTDISQLENTEITFTQASFSILIILLFIYIFKQINSKETA